MNGVNLKCSKFTMEFRQHFKKWIIPVVWIVVSLISSFLLAEYIYPEVETEKKLFGLKEINHYSFNHTLFYLSVSISLGTLFAGLALRLISPIKSVSDWMAKRIFQSPWFILVLTLTSGGFYVMGLTKRLFISETLFFAEKEVTLLNSIRMLFDNNENFLGTIIFTFTIVFPILKYTLLLFSLIIKEIESISRLNRWMSMISKWSMLDVYIVALLLLNMKFDSRIVNMELKEGVVWFSLSIILIMVAMSIPRHVRSHSQEN